MTDDLISRQAAINLFPNDTLYWDTFDGYIAPHEARRLIKELPSAQKIGKWVHLGGDEWCCSACGEVEHTEGSWEHPLKDREWKYCRTCGARMVK